MLPLRLSPKQRFGSLAMLSLWWVGLGAIGRSQFLIAFDVAADVNAVADITAWH